MKAAAANITTGSCRSSQDSSASCLPHLCRSSASLSSRSRAPPSVDSAFSSCIHTRHRRNAGQSPPLLPPRPAYQQHCTTQGAQFKQHHSSISHGPEQVACTPPLSRSVARPHDPCLHAQRLGLPCACPELVPQRLHLRASKHDPRQPPAHHMRNKYL